MPRRNTPTIPSETRWRCIMQEVWRDIYFIENGITYDYRGRYQVSNWGRIKSLKHKGNNGSTIGERILKGWNNGKGYLVVSLCKNGKRKNHYVHRLVTIHFIPNPENKPEVNHKRGNKADNRATELEWATTSENAIHLKEVLKVKYNLDGLNKSREKQKRCVSMFDLEGNFIKTFNSLADASRETKINLGCICGCCKNIYKTAGGYIWRYKDTA